MAPVRHGGQGPGQQQVLLGAGLGAQVAVVGTEALGGLHHGRSAGEHGVVGADGPAEGVDDLGLGDDVEVTSGVELDVDHGEGLQARTEAGAGAAHALGHGAHLAVVAGEHYDDAVGLTQLVGAQDDRLVPVQPARHGRSLSRSLSAERG